MFFRNLLLPTFWVSEFREPKCVFTIFYYPYFGCPNFGNPNIFDQNFHCDTLAMIYCQDFGCPNFGNPSVFFCNFLLPILWVSEFRKPKFQTKPLVVLCCYYHIPHTMRQTVEIRISSTVLRNFGQIVRKSKKFHITSQIRNKIEYFFKCVEI